MTFSRRQFLKNISASALASASLAGIVNPLTAFQAQAQENDDYRALVCVFLLGGIDNHDIVLPYDTDSFNKFSRIRQSLLTQYGDNRLRENLLPLNPFNSSDFSGRQFALPPELPNIKSLFDQGNAAIIGNVGPLVVPTQRDQFLLDNVDLPPRLFSHNDQQAVWQSSQPEGAQFGWGGLFADAALNNNSANSSTFSSITSRGNELFLTGEVANPFQISSEGSVTIELLDLFSELAPNSQLVQTLSSHFQSQRFSSNNLIQTDVSNIMQNAFTANAQFNEAILSATAINQAFPQSQLGAQLDLIARTISVREALGVNRQVFFVGIGGFDTHSNQADELPQLQQQIDSSITAFYLAMNELGIQDNVTLFTASDFGRTLAVNGDGTDHGWGAHHLVVGGAVRGNQIYGSIPEPVFGHQQDAGSGRLIPTASVEQFAAPMGRWFGLNDQQLQTALPNLANFVGLPSLDFI